MEEGYECEVDHGVQAKGDYYRSLAEFKYENEKKEVVDQSLKAFQSASTTAEVDFYPTHPIRLSLKSCQGLCSFALE